MTYQMGSDLLLPPFCYIYESIPFTATLVRLSRSILALKKKSSTNVGSMLARRLRRRASIEPALGQNSNLVVKMLT